jgi:hypothetical protein
MEILLLVAIIAAGASGLYVAVTFNTRTRQNISPLIDDAIKHVSEQIDTTVKDLRQQLRMITDDLRQDRKQIILDQSKIQGRLDKTDHEISSIARQVLAEFRTVKRLVEQTGVRQDHFSGDLPQLDHQVTQLRESLAQQSAREHQADETQPALLQEPERPEIVCFTVPNKLYAEKFRFSIIDTQPDSLSQSERQVLIQVECSVGELPMERSSDLGEASTIIRRTENDEGFRERLSDAASNYLADKWGDPVFAVATERWITQDSFPETAAAEACNNIANGLNIIVEKPLEKIGTEIRLPGPVTAAAAGIGAELILQPVTEQLGHAADFLEITGVVIGVMTGLHPLALASAKMLAHDQFHDVVARGLKEAAVKVFGKPGPQSPHDVEPAPTPDGAVEALEPPGDKNTTTETVGGLGPDRPLPKQTPPPEPQTTPESYVPEITIGGPDFW